MEFNVELIKKELNDLPTLPVVVQELRKQLSDPNSSAADIAKIVTNDVSISTRILRLVNSAFYGLERKVDSIQHAVAYLGFRNIYNIVLNLSVFRLFSSKLNQTGFDWKEFWLHCIATAYASKTLAINVGFKDPDAAFTAGLLHDIGKIITGYKFPEHFEEIITYANQHKISYYEAELALKNSITHAEIGFMAMNLWNIPAIISAPVKHHHQHESLDRVGLNTSKDIIVDIVIIADVIVQKLNLGKNGSFDVPKFPLSPVARLKIDTDLMAKIKEQVEENNNNIKSVLSILT